MRMIVLDTLPRHPTKRYKWRQHTDVTGIVIHTTDMLFPSIYEIAEYDIGPNHISKTGCPEITYHDIITSRAIYHCVDYRKVTWHAAGHNKKNLAVALHYKCQENNQPILPEDNMMKLLYTHLSNLCMDYGIPPENIKGHRELKGTGWIFDRKGSKRLKKVCPGMGLDLNLLRVNVTKLIQVKLFSLNLYHGNIDGDWGCKTAYSFADYLEGK